MLDRDALPAWAQATYRPDDEALRVFARTPEMHEAWLAFANVALKAPGRLGARMKELIRLKSAHINHCTR
jgi:alkylhydroperoxidase family enzyme